MVFDRDPVLHQKAAEPEPQRRINWDAALAGIGDRHLRAAGDALWVAGKLDDGKWQKDAAVEFTQPDGSVQAAVVVRSTSDGMVHLRAEEVGTRFIVPESRVRPLSAALKQAKLKSELARTAAQQERFAMTRSLTPVDSEGLEYTATLQLDAGFKPSEADVAMFVRRAFPGARIVDGDDRQPGRLHVRLRFANKQLAKLAYEDSTGVDRQPTNEGTADNDTAYESMFVEPLSHNDSNEDMLHHADQKSMVQKVSPADMMRGEKAREEIEREEAKRRERRLRRRDDDSYRTMAPSELPDWLESSGHTAAGEWGPLGWAKMLETRPKIEVEDEVEDRELSEENDENESDEMPKKAVDSTAKSYWKKYYDEYGDELVKNLAAKTASLFTDPVLHMEVVASLSRGFEINAQEEGDYKIHETVSPEELAHAVLGRPQFQQYVDFELARFLPQNKQLMKADKPTQLAALIRAKPQIGRYLMDPRRFESDGDVLGPDQDPTYFEWWKTKKERPNSNVRVQKTSPVFPSDRLWVPAPAAPSAPAPTPAPAPEVDSRGRPRKKVLGQRAFGDIPFRIENPRRDGAYNYVDVIFDADAAKGTHLPNFVETAFRAHVSQLKVDWGWVSAVRVMALDPEAGIATLRYRSNQPATAIPAVRTQ